MASSNDVQFFAFVIMPFKPEFNKIYRDLIVPPLEAEGYKVQRADSFIDQQNILKHIIPSIANADLIIAEITSLNANVLYELGIAHTLAKPTVLLTQDVENLPFDLRTYNAVRYDTQYDSVPILHQRLREIAQGRKNNSIVFGNPVTDFAPEMYKLDINSNAIQLTISLRQVAGHSTDETSAIQNTEEAEKGVYDYAVESTEALKTITSSTNRMLDMTNELSASMLARAAELQLLQERKTSHAIEQLKVVNLAASDVKRFADGIQVELPIFRNSWDKVFENVQGLLTTAMVRNENDIKALTDFKHKMEGLQEGSRQGLAGIYRLYQEIGNLREIKLSYEFNQAVILAYKALKELIDSFLIGEAHISRTINIIDELFDRNSPLIREE